MKLVIEDGVLKSCVLAKREHTVDLPETVRKIDNYAFAGNPKGQIRHLTLPDSLEYIAPKAFSGLERLLSLTAFTCGWDRPECRKVNDEDAGSELIAGVDTLILLQGKGGNFFAWGYLMQEDPRCLIMANNMDAGCWFEDRGKWKEGYISSIEELIVFIAPTADPEGKEYFNGSLIKDMHESLKKLRIVTDIQLRFIRGELGSWADYLESIRFEDIYSEPGWFSPLVIMDFDYMESLNALEELVLPEGLMSIGAGAFYGCGSLKKVVMPSTVAKIGSNAFRDCRSLRQVFFCNNKMAAFGPGAFYGCDRLKSIFLYTEGYIRSDQEVTHTTDAGAFLARGRIMYFFYEVDSYIHTLANADLFRQYDTALFRFEEYIRKEINNLEEYGSGDTSFYHWIVRVRQTLDYGWDLLKTRLEYDAPGKIDAGLLDALEAGVKKMGEYIMSQEAELRYAARPVDPDGKYDVRPAEKKN